MFSKRIRELRVRKKMSQERLARLAGVSLNTIVKIESGESKHPTIQTMAGIAKALEVSLDDLIKQI
jgi:transcriptional regulator with XRE-family HTH domain